MHAAREVAVKAVPRARRRAQHAQRDPTTERARARTDSQERRCKRGGWRGERLPRSPTEMHAGVLTRKDGSLPSTSGCHTSTISTTRSRRAPGGPPAPRSGATHTCEGERGSGRRASARHSGRRRASARRANGRRGGRASRAGGRGSGRADSTSWSNESSNTTTVPSAHGRASSPTRIRVGGGGAGGGAAAPRRVDAGSDSDAEGGTATARWRRSRWLLGPQCARRCVPGAITENSIDPFGRSRAAPLARTASSTRATVGQRAHASVGARRPFRAKTSCVHT